MTRQQLQAQLKVYKEDGMTSVKLDAPTTGLQFEYNRIRTDINEVSEARMNITKEEAEQEIATSLSTYLKKRFG